MSRTNARYCTYIVQDSCSIKVYYLPCKFVKVALNVKRLLFFQILLAFSENLNFNCCLYKKIPAYCFSRQNTRFSHFSSFLYCMHHFHEFSLTLNVKESSIKCSKLVIFSFWLEKWKMKIGTSSFAVELHLWQSSKWSWKFSNWMSRAGWLLPKLYIPITIK